MCLLWTWKQHIPTKLGKQPTRLHSLKIQKTAAFTLTAVKINLIHALCYNVFVMTVQLSPDMNRPGVTAFTSISSVFAQVMNDSVQTSLYVCLFLPALVKLRNRVLTNHLWNLSYRSNPLVTTTQGFAEDTQTNHDSYYQTVFRKTQRYPKKSLFTITNLQGRYLQIIKLNAYRFSS